MAYSQTFTTLGAQDWTVPAGVTEVLVECWGGGGGGGGGYGFLGTNRGGGGGGGGGHIAAMIIGLTPGTFMPSAVTVGGGGAGGGAGADGSTGGVSTFSGASRILTGDGGGGGGGTSLLTLGAGGFAGETSNSGGRDREYNGGTGAAGQATVAGGGGAGGGVQGTGGNASGGTAGNANNGVGFLGTDGDGGRGQASGLAGQSGFPFGGGGGGGWGDVGGYAGGAGRVRIQQFDFGYAELSGETLTTITGRRVITGFVAVSGMTDAVALALAEHRAIGVYTAEGQIVGILPTIPHSGEVDLFEDSSLQVSNALMTARAIALGSGQTDALTIAQRLIRPTAAGSGESNVAATSMRDVRADVALDAEGLLKYKPIQVFEDFMVAYGPTAYWRLGETEGLVLGDVMANAQNLVLDSTVGITHHVAGIPRDGESYALQSANTQREAVTSAGGKCQVGRPGSFGLLFRPGSLPAVDGEFDCIMGVFDDASSAACEIGLYRVNSTNNRWAVRNTTTGGTVTITQHTLAPGLGVNYLLWLTMSAAGNATLWVANTAGQTSSPAGSVALFTSPKVTLGHETSGQSTTGIWDEMFWFNSFVPSSLDVQKVFDYTRMKFNQMETEAAISNLSATLIGIQQGIADSMVAEGGLAFPEARVQRHGQAVGSGESVADLTAQRLVAGAPAAQSAESTWAGDAELEIRSALIDLFGEVEVIFDSRQTYFGAVAWSGESGATALGMRVLQDPGAALSGLTAFAGTGQQVHAMLASVNAGSTLLHQGTVVLQALGTASGQSEWSAAGVKILVGVGVLDVQGNWMSSGSFLLLSEATWEALSDFQAAPLMLSPPPILVLTDSAVVTLLASDVPAVLLEVVESVPYSADTSDMPVVTLGVSDAPVVALVVGDNPIQTS